jgi:hypothetical protein
MYLSLPIPIDVQNVDILDCLKAFMSEEILD